MSSNPSTYVRFYSGLKAQNLLHGFLPQKGQFQPYSGWFALAFSCFTMVFTGYYLFEPGAFVVADFIFVYGACFIFIVLFCVWKIKGIMRGEQRGFGIPAADMDFFSGLEEIEKLTMEYEAERSAEGDKGVLRKAYNVVF